MKPFKTFLSVLLGLTIIAADVEARGDAKRGGGGGGRAKPSSHGGGGGGGAKRNPMTGSKVQRSIEQPINAVKNIVKNPVGSLKQAPKTVGRFSATSAPPSAAPRKRRRSAVPATGRSPRRARSAGASVKRRKMSRDSTRRTSKPPSS